MTSSEQAPRPRGLSRGHFRQIARNGFGDGGNSYAYSYAWYDGHLYIGTIRHLLVLIKKRLPFEMPNQVWPVPVPESDGHLDLCAQVWRYGPEAGSWECVYRSPMTKGLNDRDVPLATGFRNMAVFRGKGDSRPAIYTIASCGSYGLGPVLLRAPDGVHFEPASEPGLGLGDPNLTTFRGVLPFKGRLFMAPSGTRGGYCNMAYNAVVLCSEDPARGRWEASSLPAFGDPANVSVYDFCACGDYLYASTASIRHGFQLWKTDAEGPPPHRWTRVLDRGADRVPVNQAALAMAEFGGNLYLGTAVQNGGYDKIHNIGPAAAEVIRVYPDDTWDLVVGEPRLTRRGLKVPSSGYGPGFDNPFAGYMWRLCAHDGALYVGTYDSSSFLPFSDPDRWPAWSRRLLDPESLARLMELRGGCELWRSTDGDDWVPITRNGFDNPFNYGVRTLLSTPAGLFVGSANPFGPQVAVRGPAGWRYEDNPRGGIEVWHGAPENAGFDEPRAGAAGLEPAALLWGDARTPGEFLGSLADGVNGGVAPTAGADPLLGSLAGLAGREAPARARHAMADWEARREALWEHDPLQRLADSDKELVGLSEDLDDELAGYFGRGPLRNVGYWRDRAGTPRQACEQLPEELLALVPPAGDGTFPASVLVVAAGAAALAPRLRRQWPSAAVTAVVPGAAYDGEVTDPDPNVSLLGADSASLPVPDGSFDVVVWVEGASVLGGHTPDWQEVHRVLRPGGRLLAADFVGTPVEQEGALLEAPGGAEAVAGCQRDLERAGLVEARAFDVTGATWLPFFRHSREFFATKLLFRQVDPEQHDRVLAALPGGGLAVAAYVLVHAAKPPEA